MSNKLRVFVSSTMADLANERDAVCRQLHDFNFDPVNAEGWLPTGADTWTKIEQEIESSHVFLLILGERYGWIPTEGPHSDARLSATHLEYRAAKNLNLPILVFPKKLSYYSERDSDDARLRDTFRKEASAWEGGQFVREFHLASDLAISAGNALVEVLTNEFLKEKIRQRAGDAARSRRKMEQDQEIRTVGQGIVIPPRLAEIVASRKAVLFAGAGISWSGGMPSQAVFSQHLARVLLKRQPDYSVSSAASELKAIATDVEASTSRAALLEEIGRVLHPPQGLHATLAHGMAVCLFDVIVTTNWDGLFEEAALTCNQHFDVVTREISDDLSKRSIVKLHGSYADPESLLATEVEVFTMDSKRPRLWEAVRELIRSRPLIVVGSSLRDPSVIRLFADGRPENFGYFLARSSFEANAARVRKWNLECISGDVEAFFAALTASVKGEADSARRALNR
jgi:Domain of unknown function (DUF4062)/SIR2-like domain